MNNNFRTVLRLKKKKTNKERKKETKTSGINTAPPAGLIYDYATIASPKGD